MRALTLYDASEHLSLLLDQIDPETGEMSEALGAALSKFEGKSQSIAAYILNQEATADAIDEAIKKLEKRAMGFRKKADSLKQYLQDNMKRAGITQITADDGTFTAKLYRERDVSVEIFESKLIPIAYMRQVPPPEPAPDKNRIKESLKAGTDVPGARLLKKDRLEIKA